MPSTNNDFHRSYSSNENFETDAGVRELLEASYSDDGIWQNLKIPSRLKLELKKYILHTDNNGRSSFDEDISVGQSTISPRMASQFYDSVSHVSIDNDYDSDYSERIPKFIHNNEPVKQESSVTYIPYEPEELEAETEEATLITCDIWVKCFSDEHKYYYYYNKNTQETQWECPDDSKVYLVYEDIMSTVDSSWNDSTGGDHVYDYNEVEYVSHHEATAYEGEYDGPGFEEYGDHEQKQGFEPDVFSEEISGENTDQFLYGTGDDSGTPVDPEEAHGSEQKRKKGPQVFHFKDLSPEDGKKFLKPLQKRGKTIFAESPMSILSSVIDQESPKSMLQRKSSGLSSCQEESVEEKESYGIAEDDYDEAPFYVSPARRSSRNEESGDDTESDTSEYFVVSEVHSSPSKRSVTRCDSESKPKVRVPPLAIRVDAPMISRDDFLSALDDGYSVSLRDLAMGSSDSASSPKDLRHRPLASSASPPQKPPPVTEVIELQSRTAPVDHADEGKSPTKKLKKTTSAAKKMFKFMNSIVGSKSGNNINPSKTSAPEKPSTLRMGSEFSHTLLRTEKASNTAVDGGTAAITATKSSEFQYDEVYPQCEDEVMHNMSIAGVNCAVRRGSSGSLAIVDSGRTTLDSQRTFLMDSQRSVPDKATATSSSAYGAMPGGTIKLSTISIDTAQDGGVSVASSASTDRQSNSSINSTGKTSTTPNTFSSSSAKDKFSVDVNSFFSEMKSLGFTEAECVKALEATDSRIMEATTWLLQEAEEKDLSSRGQVTSDPLKKKRSKFKKNMSKFFALEV
eukprot:gene29426-38520_t